MSAIIDPNKYIQQESRPGMTLLICTLSKVDVAP
jgi:hypothetical protein